MSKEYLAQEKLNDALTQVRLLWQSPCSAAEFNDGVRALVGASQEAVETIKRLRKIAAYVPARVYIEAKEKAGFSEQIVTTASAQETSPVPAKHCQNGGDVCLAGNRDGICCPDDSCDIDDGVRKDPTANR